MKLKKVITLLVAVVMVFAALPVMAATSIEYIFEDVTADDTTTLMGEAKIKVSVKGAKGDVSAVQTAMKFTGDLEYKSIEFLQGENNPPACFYVAPDADEANDSGEIVPCIVTGRKNDKPYTLSFSDITELFVITFEGEPGDSVTLSIDEDESKSFVTVNGEQTFAKTTTKDEEAVASSTSNEGKDAVVTIKMDSVTDFVTGGKDSFLTLTITNEQTKSTIRTVINTSVAKKGGDGHYDGKMPPSFIVENTVLSGKYTYTVEVWGEGFVPYKESGIDFDDELVVDNNNFVPGDVNRDGKVTTADKEECQKFIDEGKYSIYADFNRDGATNSKDLKVIEKFAVSEDAPAKMSKPSVEGGSKKITVEWKKPDGDVTGYVVKYGKAEDEMNKTVEISKATTLKTTISSLSANTTYYVAVAAKNEFGTGEFSDVVSDKTDKESGESGGSTGGGGGGTGGGGGSYGGGSAGGNTVAPVQPSNPNEPFTDLGNHLWAKEFIYKLKNAGFISGTSATTYSPANNIKRGDFILILTRMLGIEDEFSENFADVPSSSYYYNAIGSAKAAGIAQGSGENFMPENTITRQDLITLAYRAFLNLGYIEEVEDTSALDEFSDKETISDYALSPMASMVSAGIIKGSDGVVNPKGFATRAEVAVMCARLMDIMK